MVRAVTARDGAVEGDGGVCRDVDDDVRGPRQSVGVEERGA